MDPLLYKFVILKTSEQPLFAVFGYGSIVYKSKVAFPKTEVLEKPQYIQINIIVILY